MVVCQYMARYSWYFLGDFSLWWYASTWQGILDISWETSVYGGMPVCGKVFLIFLGRLQSMVVCQYVARYSWYFLGDFSLWWYASTWQGILDISWETSVYGGMPVCGKVFLIFLGRLQSMVVCQYMARYSWYFLGDFSLWWYASMWQGILDISWETSVYGGMPVRGKVFLIFLGRLQSMVVCQYVARYSWYFLGDFSLWWYASMWQGILDISWETSVYGGMPVRGKVFLIFLGRLQSMVGMPVRGKVFLIFLGRLQSMVVCQYVARYSWYFLGDFSLWWYASMWQGILDISWETSVYGGMPVCGKVFLIFLGRLQSMVVCQYVARYSWYFLGDFSLWWYASMWQGILDISWETSVYGGMPVRGKVFLIFLGRLQSMVVCQYVARYSWYFLGDFSLWWYASMWQGILDISWETSVYGGMPVRGKVFLIFLGRLQTMVVCQYVARYSW